MKLTIDIKGVLPYRDLNLEMDKAKKYENGIGIYAIENNNEICGFVEVSNPYEDSKGEMRVNFNTFFFCPESMCNISRNAHSDMIVDLLRRVIVEEVKEEIEKLATSIVTALRNIKTSTDNIPTKKEQGDMIVTLARKIDKATDNLPTRHELDERIDKLASAFSYQVDFEDITNRIEDLKSAVSEISNKPSVERSGISEETLVELAKALKS